MLYDIYTLFSLCLLVLTILTPYEGIEVTDKQELENEMITLFGVDGPIPDFMFFTQSQKDNYTLFKGSPEDHTRRPGKKTKPKNRTSTERIFARALRKYNKGEFIEELEWAAKIVNWAMDPTVENKTLKAVRRITSKKSITNLRRERKKRETLRKKRSLMDKIADLFLEEPYLNRRFFEHDEEESRIDNNNDNDIIKQLESKISEDENDVIKLKDENGVIKLVEELEELEELNPISKDKELLPGPLLGRTYDYDPSMQNDGASFTYTNAPSDVCYDEGSQGTTDTYIRLCATCTKEIDFGDSISPQFAFSVECLDDAPACLNGDGGCTQKILYYNFLAMTGIDSTTQKQIWTPYKQYLNISCECECLTGSMVDENFVGVSNV